MKVSERRLRTLVDKLTKDGMIEVVSNYPRFTVYRILNYAKYNQQNDQQESQSGQGESGSDDQHSDQRTTSRRPAGDQRATTKEQGNNKANKVNKVIKERSQDTVDLTNHLISWIQSNNPSAKIPTSLEKWNDEMERIERLDKYDYMQIRSVIDWCQQDSFWKSNVLSVPKLREKMGTLIMQMQRPKGGSNGKVSSFERLQQMHKEEITREASGHY